MPLTMFEAYGPFTRFFESGRSPASSYLAMLNVRRADGIVEQIRNAVADSGSQLDQYLRALLDEMNWRPHLVAAATMVVTRSGKGVVDQVWATLDRYSWVSPQLAAAASRVDPSFAVNAKLRIERHCWLDDPEKRARYTAAGVAYSEPHDKKLVGALAALCERRPETQPWLSSVLADPTLQGMLSDDRREHRGCEIAIDWLEHLDAQIESG